MSATGVNSPSSAAARTHARPSTNEGLSPPAAAYLVAVIGVAALLLASRHVESATHGDWLLFAVLTACAAPIQLLSVESPAHQWYSPALVFFVAGALLLPPQLVALMIVLAHVPDLGAGALALARPGLQHRQLDLRRADRVTACAVCSSTAATPVRTSRGWHWAARSPP